MLALSPGSSQYGESYLKGYILKVETIGIKITIHIPEPSLSVIGCGAGGISLLSFKVMSKSKYQ